MGSTACLVLALLAMAACGAHARDGDATELRLPSFFSDNMVLQGQPLNARIWGWAASNASVSVTVGTKLSVTASADANGAWTAVFAAVPHGGPYDVVISTNTDKITLGNVLFGDVFLCSGQSNMQMALNSVYNATEEIADSINYPNLRLFTTKYVWQPQPTDDVTSAAPYVWGVSGPDVVNNSNVFSAVCYLYGRDLIRQNPNAIIGLVASMLGGTAVECWSSPDAIKECTSTNPAAASRMRRGGQPATQLYNGMIYPFLKMSFKGVLWYQGEQNNDEPALYRCMFPAMIKDWRRKFVDSADLPFLFVQLAPVTNAGLDFAQIREAQTEAMTLPFVGMAVTYDLGDPDSPYDSIHPRNKQEVARRLYLLARTIIYEEEDVITQGPRYLFAQRSEKPTPAGEFKVTLAFEVGSGELSLGGSEKCTACCNGDAAFDVADAKGAWAPAVSAAVIPSKSADGVVYVEVTSPASTGRPTGVRFAYSNAPQCAIYGSDHLPTPPFLTYFV